MGLKKNKKCIIVVGVMLIFTKIGRLSAKNKKGEKWIE